MTITLSAEAAEQAEALARDRGNASVLECVEMMIEEAGTQLALRNSMADLEAGRTRNAEEFFDSLGKKYGIALEK